MAGQPEIRIMSEFFNQKSKNSLVCDFRAAKPKRIKSDFEELKGKKWKVSSISRGKETKLIFISGDQKHEMLLNFFKGGCWEWYPDEISTQQNPNYLRDHRFSLHFEDGTILSHQDQFHQSHWRWSEKWGRYRSPDMVLENNAYRKFMYEKRHHLHFEKPIYIAMMHQWFFNGINNFSRSEILARTRFSPFTLTKEILSSEILREDLFENMKEVLEDIYRLGGMQFGIWKNPFTQDKHLLNKWIRVYRKKEHLWIPDNGKMFYCSNKWKNEWKVLQLQSKTFQSNEEELFDGVNDKSDI